MFFRLLIQGLEWFAKLQRVSVLKWLMELSRVFGVNSHCGERLVDFTPNFGPFVSVVDELTSAIKALI